MLAAGAVEVQEVETVVVSAAVVVVAEAEPDGAAEEEETASPLTIDKAIHSDGASAE